MTVASPKVMTMNWNDVLMYPQLDAPLAMTFAPTVKLPANWKYGTALTTKGAKDATVTFNETTLEALIDSPLLAGEYVREVKLDDRHRVVMACDSPDGA